MDGIHSCQNVVYKALVKLLKSNTKDRSDILCYQADGLQAFERILKGKEIPAREVQNAREAPFFRAWSCA